MGVWFDMWMKMTHKCCSYLNSAEMAGEFVCFDDVICIYDDIRAVCPPGTAQSVMVSGDVRRYSITLHITSLANKIIFALAFTYERGK